MRPAWLALLALLLLPLPARAEIRIAITVDDIPLHGPLPPGVTRLQLADRILDTFRKEKIPDAVGFINAKALEAEPDLIRVYEHWIEAGYSLGNHTYSHPSLDQVSVAQFEKEIDLNEPVLKRVSPNRRWSYFRYPFLHEGASLEKHDAVRAYLAGRQYENASVTMDFGDWAWNGPYVRCLSKKDSRAIDWLRETYLQSAMAILEEAGALSRKLFHRAIPQVLLLHIGAMDAEMLESLIQEYKAKGVRFIALSEALKDEAYSMNPHTGINSGAELTYRILESRGIQAKDLGIQPHRDLPLKAVQSKCR